MKILHLKNVFNQSNECIEYAEKKGFKPAPCISAKDMPEFTKANVADYIKFHKPNPDFFNAEKVFFWEDEDYFSEMEKICLPFIDKMTLKYMEKNSIPDWHGYSMEYYSVLKYKKGGFFRYHQDTINHPDGRFKGLAFCIYMSDFTGGELEFPDHGVTIKPNKGDVIIFPSGEHYKHICHEITSGIKYCMTLWALTEKRLEITKSV